MKTLKNWQAALVVLVAVLVIFPAQSFAQRDRVGEHRYMWDRFWGASNPVFDQNRGRGYNGGGGGYGGGGGCSGGGGYIDPAVSENLMTIIGKIVVARRSEPAPSEPAVVYAPAETMVGHSSAERTVIFESPKPSAESLRQQEEKLREKLFLNLLLQAKSSDLEQRREAIEKLGDFPPDERSRDIFVKALKNDPNPEIRLAVVAAFAKQMDQEALSSLKKALDDPDDRVRHEASQLIEELEIDAIMKRLNSEDADDRESAASKLAKISNKEFARKVLEKILVNDSDPDVREAAVEGLHDLANPSSLPVLAQAVKGDPSKDVREEAREAIKHINEVVKKEASKASPRPVTEKPAK